MAATGTPLDKFAGIERPSAVNDLGLGGSLTPDELAERKKKLMAAGGGMDNQFGSAVSALFGSRAAQY